MLDKLILVFYVDVGNMDHDEAHHYIKLIAEKTTPLPQDKEHMLRYVIPVRDGGTRVECLNPPSSCCHNGNFAEKLDSVNDRLDRMDGILFPVTRSVITEKQK